MTHLNCSKLGIFRKVSRSSISDWAHDLNVSWKPSYNLKSFDASSSLFNLITFSLFSTSDLLKKSSAGKTWLSVKVDVKSGLVSPKSTIRLYPRLPQVSICLRSFSSASRAVCRPAPAFMTSSSNSISAPAYLKNVATLPFLSQTKRYRPAWFAFKASAATYLRLMLSQLGGSRL